MRDMVHVQVEGQSFSFNLEGKAPLAPDAARAWLDSQFTEMEGLKRSESRFLLLLFS